MKLTYFILFICLCSFYERVSTTSCIENGCQLEEVKNSCPYVPAKCPKGTVLRSGGLCYCCLFCKKIIYEGDDCSPETPIAGATSDKVVCADGLRCVRNVCRKIQS